MLLGELSRLFIEPVGEAGLSGDDTAGAYDGRRCRVTGAAVETSAVGLEKFDIEVCCRKRFVLLVDLLGRGDAEGDLTFPD